MFKFYNMISLLILLSTITSFLFVLCNSQCYFSYEYKGFYVTQNTVSNNHVDYSEINITDFTIPIWGMCHKRIGYNVILKDETAETSCYRCFSMKLVSRNILSVITTEKKYDSKCYTSEEKVIASCPTDENLQTNFRHYEIIFYKTKEIDQTDIRREYCPFTGKYKVIYNIDDGSEDKIECPHPSSELDSCPSGSSMNIRLKNCSFENTDIRFECLGSWKNLHNNYVALMHSKKYGVLGPQYRCAIYEEIKETGVIQMSFSNDSTCSAIHAYSHNNNAGIAHGETLTLYPVPVEKQAFNQYCNFPDWMIGNWEHFSIDKSTIIYKDHTSFKTYTMKCIQNVFESEKFYVFSRTQCGEEMYHCINIKQRTDNILEFQMSVKSNLNNNALDICSDDEFSKDQWLTQTRLEKNFKISPCPVSGDFFGTLPDGEGLCAKLSSNCTSPDIMNYQVTLCANNGLIEERKYQCLGQWEENNLVYIYTRRLDFDTYECFVGAMNTETNIFIKEAGERCQRYTEPKRYGMELNKTENCKDLPVTPIHPTTRYHTTIASNDQSMDDTEHLNMHTTTSNPNSALNTQWNYKFITSLIILTVLFL